MNRQILFIIGIIAVYLIIFLLALILFKNELYVYFVTKHIKSFSKGHLMIYDKHTNLTILDQHVDNNIVGKIYVDNFPIFCKEIAKKGDIGLGELYMQGKWWSPDLVSLIKVLLINNNNNNIQNKSKFTTKSLNDKKNVQKHYDIGNDFYNSFLKDDMHIYSCAFFLNQEEDLNKAQYNKVNVIINKLELKPHERVIDIGCGWGSIANYIAKKTNTRVDGITLSNEQYKFISTKHPHINVSVINYKDLPTSLNNVYDKAYSIGMFEHVRFPNYNLFFETVNRIIKNNGRLVLHTITYTSSSKNNSTKNQQAKSFISEYVFPGGQIPEIDWVVNAASEKGFCLTHMEVYGGQNYGKTLQMWRNNLMNDYENLKQMGYSEQTIKMFEFYFAECEASFYLDNMCITHFVFDKVSTLDNVSNKFIMNRIE